MYSLAYEVSLAAAKMLFIMGFRLMALDTGILRTLKRGDSTTLFSELCKIYNFQQHHASIECAEALPGREVRR